RALRTCTCRSKAKAMVSAGASRGSALRRHPSRSTRRSSASSRRTTSNASRSRVCRRMGVAELTRNAVDVLPEDALEAKLKLNRALRIKLGIDPTSPDLHLGFAYALENLPACHDEGRE